MSDLKTRNLGDLIQIRKGKKPASVLPRRQNEAQRPYLLIDSFGGEYKSFTDDASCPYAKANETLLVWDGERCGLTSTGHEGYIGSTLAAIESTTEDLRPDYLFHFLVSKQKEIRNSAEGTGVPHVSRRFLEDLEIKLPPLPEQKKIAEILSGIDREVTGVSKVIQRKRRLRESLLRQLIPHPSTFLDGLPPRDWTLAAIEDICSLITYGFTNPMPTTERGIYMVTAKDVKDGKIDKNTVRFTSIEAYETLLTDKSRPKRNDILVTKDGTLGRTAVVGEETICINQSVALLRPTDERNSQFLQLLLSSPQYQETMLEESGGSAVKHIYITMLAKMQIAMPTSTEARERVINYFDALNKSTHLSTKKHECLTNLKKALASDLLSGRKRVSV